MRAVSLPARWQMAEFAGLGYELGVPTDDPDFKAFVAIESETDHLPIGDVRKLWQPEALDRKANEISEAEAWARDIAADACRRIISRFAGD